MAMCCLDWPRHSVHGRVETLDAVLQAIENITAEELIEVAHTWLAPQSMGSVTFLPD